MSDIGSLAYRRNKDAIWNGHAQDKYLRLLPYITGKRILELGAAEGVLSLLMAERDQSAQVQALEVMPERHLNALKLQERWRFLGRRVDGCTMVCGDIRDRFDLLEGVDTLVAIRLIYHLRESIRDVFTAVAAAGVSRVVLGGNPNRARMYFQANGQPTEKLGRFNFYASVEGMTQVLQDAGYTIGTVVKDGDPIVTGHC